MHPLLDLSKEVSESNLYKNVVWPPCVVAATSHTKGLFISYTLRWFNVSNLGRHQLKVCHFLLGHL